MQKSWGMLVAVIGAVILAATTAGADAKTPADYGRVVMNNYSKKAGLVPVVFDHWLHRTKYTCRLCHVDIGFGMKAGTTDIRAADNMKGVYCGVCHNGKMQAGGKALFASCSTDRSDLTRCERCHFQRTSVKKDHDFTAIAAKFPRDKHGNGIDWEKPWRTG